MNHGAQSDNPSAPTTRAGLLGHRNTLGLLAAGLGMVGLLLALTTVVRDVVTKAQARHATVAASSAAHFRCNTIAAHAQRNDCRSRAGDLPAPDPQ